MNEQDRARKLEFQKSRRGRNSRSGNGPTHSEGRIESATVQEIIDRPYDFDKKARPDDTRAVRSVEYVPDIGSGDIPALHARWQEEGWIARINKTEAEMLHRTGFRTHRNREVNCEDMYWRRKDVHHLWIGMLTITDDEGGRSGSACWVGSEVSKSSQLTKQKRWEVLSKVDDPIIPFFNGYEVTHETMVREALIEAWSKIGAVVPGFLKDQDFWEVLKMVCDDGAERFNMLYSSGPSEFVLQSVEVGDVSKHIKSGAHQELLNS